MRERPGRGRLLGAQIDQDGVAEPCTAHAPGGEAPTEGLGQLRVNLFLPGGGIAASARFQQDFRHPRARLRAEIFLLEAIGSSGKTHTRPLIESLAVVTLAARRHRHALRHEAGHPQLDRELGFLLPVELDDLLVQNRLDLLGLVIGQAFRRGLELELVPSPIADRPQAPVRLEILPAA